MSTQTLTRERRGPGTGERRLGPGARKLVLTVHVVLSVAWAGVAGCLIVLALVGLDATGPAAEAVFGAVEVLGGTLLTPLSFAAFVSGIVLSLGTKWGLVRYWWVAAKLVLTTGLVLATNLALGRHIANAAKAAATGTDVGDPGSGVLYGSIAALALLVVMTVLSVYKPWGRTPRGRRQAAIQVNRRTTT